MNDQELEKMVLETYKISRENREFLRRIEGRQKIAHIGKYLKAVLLIALVIAAYVYVSPHWAELQSAANSVSAVAEGVGSLVPARTGQ